MNDYQSQLNRSLDDHNELLLRLRRTCLDSVILAAMKLAEVLSGEGTIFICGNGGSASDSQHLAGELLGRFVNNRRPLRSISLAADPSVLTCIANDFGYDEIFSRQIQGLAKSGDLLIATSTSGNSTNIVKALKMAKSIQISTIALLGNEGGEAAGIADVSIVVPSRETARIQEMHLLINHLFCEVLEKELFLL